MGSPASRVRISLARPLAHHVRSDRNTIVVDFDRAAGRRAPPFVMPPASRQLEQLGARIECRPLIRLRALGLSQRAGAVAARLRRRQSPARRPDAGAGAAGSRASSAGPADERAPYSGKPVSLDFQQADLRAVLRVFSEISGLNIVIDPAVQGTVDVALRDVPWDQALDIILRANKLGYHRRRHRSCASRR